MTQPTCKTCVFWRDDDLFDRCSKRPGTSTLICFMYKEKAKKEAK